MQCRDKQHNLRRLEAQRNELNTKGSIPCCSNRFAPNSANSADTSCGVAVRQLREELQLLQEPGSYVGEVIKVMGKKKVLCKVCLSDRRVLACPHWSAV